MSDNYFASAEKMWHRHETNRSNFQFVVWEIVAAGVVSGFYFESLGIGIVTALGVALLFNLASGRPVVAGVVSLTLGACWTFLLHNFYLAFGPDTLTLWVLTVLTFVGMVAIHGSAFQYTRDMQEAE